MTLSDLHVLPGRGVVALTGADARGWLDNLVSNDLSVLDKEPADFSALLSPQGKILFEFFVLVHGDSLLIETSRGEVAALIKRLSLYKLRAKIELREVSDAWQTLWGVRDGSALPSPIPQGAIIYADPRAPDELWRGVCPTAAAGTFPAGGDYVSERVRIGLAEAPSDYLLGDTFPHEANYDLRGGVSFGKGCFIGQEVVSRMQNKSVIRKRVVRVSADADLASDADIAVGSAVIGKIGSSVGTRALGMIRLDRAAEAEDKGETLRAGGTVIVVDPVAIAAYRQSVIDRPVHDL